jgi:hypothetical protein
MMNQVFIHLITEAHVSKKTKRISKKKTSDEESGFEDDGADLGIIEFM